MRACRRVFSAHRHVKVVESVSQYQGMASELKQKLDILSRYEMNSGYRIPVLGYGVCSLPHRRYRRDIFLLLSPAMAAYNGRFVTYV